MDLHLLTIAEARELLKKKTISSLELVKNCIDRVKLNDGILHAFLTLTEEYALKEAKIADKRISEGDETPMLGIPVAFKDIYLTSGIRTTAGSKLLENYIAPYDATVVKKLKDSGAIMIGKLNCDAWAHGSSGENSDYEPVKNPWNTEYVPGGSSSGSAVSVADGMALAAGGTDTGGSIRLPAGFTNTVGLKPTYGRVSRYGVISMASSLDTVGHFTKTVRDSAIYLQVSAGSDEKDSTTTSNRVPDYQAFLGQSIKGMKIGLPKEYLQEKGLDVKVHKAIMAAIDKIADLGAEIIEISLPYTEYAIACYYIIQPAEVSSNLARFDGIRYGNERGIFGDEAKRRIMMGTYVLSSGYYDAYYKKAMKLRTKVIDDFNSAFGKVDFIVTPASPTLPWKMGSKTSDPLAMYLSDVFTVTANIAGIPGICVPAGFIDSLPVGIQILGPQFSEQKLFQLAHAYEEITQFWKEKPGK